MTLYSYQLGLLKEQEPKALDLYGVLSKISPDRVPHKFFIQPSLVVPRVLNFSFATLSFNQVVIRLSGRQPLN